MNNSQFPDVCPVPSSVGKWDKVGQKSTFWRPAVTIFVTIVKDQDVKHMFTPSLRVYHTCQEVFLFFFELPRSSNCTLKSSACGLLQPLLNCPGLQTGDHGSQKESRRRLAADRTENIFWAMPSRSAVGLCPTDECTPTLVEAACRRHVFVACFARSDIFVRRVTVGQARPRCVAASRLF